MREVAENVYIDPDIQRYIVNLVGKTRKHRQVELGVSPRGSLALLRLSAHGPPFTNAIMSFLTI